MLDYLARFNMVPSLVAEEQVLAFAACLEALANNEEAAKLAAESKDFAYSQDDFWLPQDDWRARYRPYVVVNGILQVPIRGVLLHDYPWQLGSFATGYIYIQKAVERGMSDPGVRGVAFLIHSPGGEVAGCFESADRVFAMRGQKPIRAFAHEYAYSAAYEWASVADHITVSKTGGVGSVGVVTAHVDVSKRMENDGVKVTFITRGRHKADGNGYTPLSDEVKARIQARIDALGEIFEASVARNRGMDAETVRGFEAMTFMPDEAVSNGLADDIGPLDDALAAFAVDLSQQNDGDEEMSDQKDAAVNQAAVEAARTEGYNAGKAEGLKDGKAEGAKAATDRIKAIIESDEGKKRPKAALSMALKMASASTEEVIGVLADLAEEKAEAEAPNANAEAGKHFLNAMNEGENPDIGTEGDKDKNKASADDASAILTLAASVDLPGFRKRKA